MQPIHKKAGSQLKLENPFDLWERELLTVRLEGIELAAEEAESGLSAERELEALWAEVECTMVCSACEIEEAVMNSSG